MSKAFVKIIAPKVLYVTMPKKKDEVIRVSVKWYTYSSVPLYKIEIYAGPTIGKVLNSNLNRVLTKEDYGQQTWWADIEYVPTVSCPENSISIRATVKEGDTKVFEEKKVSLENGLESSYVGSDGIIRDLNLSDRTTDYPYALLPLRIETRWIAPNPNNLNSDELQIRVYPDDIMIHDHRGNPSEAEYRALERYKVSNEAKRLAFQRDMVRKFGAERTALLLKNNNDDKFKPLIEPPEVVKQEKSTVARWMLPQRFWSILFDMDTKEIVRKWPFINAVDPKIQKGVIIDKIDKVFPEWMTNFKKAVEMGMATTIKPPYGERFRLIVIGDYEADHSTGTWKLGKLLEGHRFSKGLAFVPSGTPTNNTQQSRSGYSSDNKVGQYSYELEENDSNIWKALLEKDPNHPMAAKILGNAFLGLNDDLEVFRNVEGASDRAPSLVREMKTILWWAIVNPFLKDQLKLTDDNTIAALKKHYLEFLSPEGPLPTIRVGNQPYGILPVTNITSGTVGAEGLKPFDVALSNLLTVLYDQWLSVANNETAVPQLGGELDPSDMFLETLRMQPVSVAESYTVRPILDNTVSNNKFPVDEILGAIRNYTYLDPNKKSSPYADLKAWADQNKSAQEVLSQYIAAWGGSSKEALSSLYPWLEIAPLTDFQLFSELGPKEDIDKCINNIDTGSLFSKILFKAKNNSSAEDKAKNTNTNSKEINDAITLLQDYEIRLTSYEILIPLNTASNTNQIVSAFQRKLRPQQKQPSSLGITNQVATNILAKRNSLPGKKFTSIEELYTVPGLNAQKLKDLASNLYQTKNLYKPDKQKPTSFNEYRQDIVPELSRIFRTTLDTLSHRLDAWMTSIAWQRLKDIRQKKSSGIYLGAYGWIDEMRRPPSNEASKFQDVFIPAPSRGQAAAAAVMYNAYLTEPKTENEHPFRLNLHSERSSKSLFLAEGVRQGQPLGALLGYQFERSLHENGLDKYIDDFRDAFPTYKGLNDDPNAESISARNVVDGLTLAQWAMDNPNLEDINVAKEDSAKIMIELGRLTDGLDAVADLLAYENIYHNVQGNYERAGAVMDAAAGRAAPPEIQAIRTPWQGTQLGHRVCMLFPYISKTAEKVGEILTSPRTVAEPCIAAWAEQMLGSAQYISCQYTPINPPTLNPQIISLSAVGLTPVDLIYLSEVSQANGMAELEQIIRHTIRKKFPLGTISIDFKYKHPIPASTQKALSMEEALMLAKQMQQLIGTCTWLRPDSLSQRSSGAAGKIDLDALEKRYAVLLADVTNLENQIKSRIRVLNGTELTKLQSLLHCASRYGIMANRQEWLITPNFPFSQSVSNILKELTKRRTEFEAEGIKIRNISPDAPLVKAEAYIQAIKALFGNSIAVLPPFKFSLESKPETIDPNTIWAADKLLSPSTATAGQIRGWLQQSALLYKPLQELEDTMMYAEALNKKAHGGLKLRATQLPFSNANEPWLALQAGKEQKNRFGRVSITTVLTDNLTANTPLAGLLLHQWEEFLPADTLTTAAAFHYNAPSTQPPQSILLAVPGQTGNKNWLVEDLAHMVNDTLNLAKVRAVDLEALKHNYIGLDLENCFPLNVINTAKSLDLSISGDFLTLTGPKVDNIITKTENVKNNDKEKTNNNDEIVINISSSKIKLKDITDEENAGYFIIQKYDNIFMGNSRKPQKGILCQISNGVSIDFSEISNSNHINMCRISIISPLVELLPLDAIYSFFKIKVNNSKTNFVANMGYSDLKLEMGYGDLELGYSNGIWIDIYNQNINKITVESGPIGPGRVIIFGIQYSLE